jgi:hypothetical protein
LTKTKKDAQKLNKHTIRAFLVDYTEGADAVCKFLVFNFQFLISPNGILRYFCDRIQVVIVLIIVLE